MTALSIKNVRLFQEAIHGFDHDFAAGELTVVLGGNQSGKTNLCRLLAGLPTNASGEVWYQEQDWTSLRPQKRSVALVFQAFVNYPNWTVAQNIASPLIAKQLDATERKRIVARLAQTLGISQVLQRLPSELSGGQQQRVAIARALAQQADVLVLDEPLVNLDYKLREALVLELKTLLAETGATVIYTSTDPRDAFALGDQVLLLHEQSVLQSGTPLGLYRSPKCLAAARLMSDPGVNLLPGPNFNGGEQCSVIRPEHVLLPGEAVQDCADTISFHMRVDSIERSGDETFLHGRVSKDGELQDEQHWVVRRPGMHSVSVGQMLELNVLGDDILNLALE
ncbi:MAG: ABC transporter ATP-binding protein [Pseudomonadota bacterium]|nr:ABC transporter ATP-binding protein [Pseudomonadota bacterium]